MASCVSVCVYSVHHTQQLAAAAQVGDARRVGDPRIRKKMQLMQDHREMKMPNRIKAARARPGGDKRPAQRLVEYGCGKGVQGSH